MIHFHWALNTFIVLLFLFNFIVTIYYAVVLRKKESYINNKEGYIKDTVFASLAFIIMLGILYPMLMYYSFNNEGIGILKGKQIDLKLAYILIVIAIQAAPIMLVVYIVKFLILHRYMSKEKYEYYQHLADKDDEVKNNKIK